jgi:hypothetical protein
MGGPRYAQELRVNFIRTNDSGVVISVKGVEKTLETGIETSMDDGIEAGEKVRLLYSDKVTWAVKKIDLTISTDKCFRRDD